MGFIIVGDTEKYNGCLVQAFVGNSWTRDRVEAQIEKLDKRVVGDCVNLRVEETKSEQEWWNDPVLRN